MLFADFFDESFLGEVDAKSEGEALKQSREKSTEELEELSVPEDIGDLERTELLLSDGHKVQKLSALRYLGRLFKDCGEAVNVVLPLLKSVTPNFSVDVQIATAQNLIAVCGEGLLPGKVVQANILPLALNMIHTPSDEVKSEWLELLLKVLPLLPKDVLEKEILTMALAKSDVSEPLSSRVASCKLLGGLAEVLQPQQVIDYLDRAYNLCQDTDSDVRLAMCQQLGLIASVIGQEKAQKELLDELFELFRDEETVVRVAAFDTLICLLALFEGDVKNKRIVPVVREIYTTKPDDLVDAVAHKFGEYIDRVSDSISKEDMEMYLDIFWRMSNHVEAEYRQLYAYNFPGILKLLGVGKYPMHFHDSFVQICRDSSDEVRATVAAGFHEVAIMLGRKTVVQYLKEPLAILLEDSVRTVRESILSHLDVILEQFYVPSESERKPVYESIWKSLVQCEQNAAPSSWRSQLALLENCTNYPKYFSSDLLHENMGGTLIKNMHLGAQPLKVFSCKLLVKFLRHNKNGSQRFEVVKKLIQEFGRSKNYADRMVFVEICDCVLEEFSRQFFKDFFIDIALDFAQDPVPNVRLKMTSLLPKLKRIVRLPNDAPHLERIQNVMALLQTDVDNDTTVIARAVSKEMSTIDVRIAQMPMPAGGKGRGYGMGDDADSADRKKEDDENEVLLAMVEADAAITDVEVMRKQLLDDILGKKGTKKSAAGGDGKKKPAAKGMSLLKKSTSDDNLLGVKMNKSSMSTGSVSKKPLPSPKSSASRTTSETKGSGGKTPGAPGQFRQRSGSLGNVSSGTSTGKPPLSARSLPTKRS